MRAHTQLPHELKPEVDAQQKRFEYVLGAFQEELGIPISSVGAHTARVIQLSQEKAMEV